VLLNLAWSCVKGSHLVEGEKYFEQLLEEGGKDLTDKQRADANDGLTQSRGKLGRIDVAAPPGAEVTVDGERAGMTPLEPLYVEPGAHTVKMKSGEGPQTVSVSVLAGERAVARYGKTAAVTTLPTPPAPPPPVETSPPPAAQPTTETAPSTTVEASAPSPPREHEQPAESSPGPFAAPNNLVPVFVLGGVAVAGFVGAGIALSVKQQANNSANQVVAAITQEAMNKGMPASCVHPTAFFQSACSELNTDYSDVNQDATAGNVLLGVGVAGAVGTLAYWLFADKKKPTAITASASVSSSFRGLVVLGEF
jgi:hypothetical protein